MMFHFLITTYFKNLDKDKSNNFNFLWGKVKATKKGKKESHNWKKFLKWYTLFDMLKKALY